MCSLPPSHALLLHIFSCAPWRARAHGQCRLVCQCWGHTHRAPLCCLNSPAKTHVPSPGDTRIPTQHGHGRTPVPVPLGPVSCSTGSLIVPVSSVRPSHGAQRHRTRARAGGPTCDPLGATGSKHSSGVTPTCVHRPPPMHTYVVAAAPSLHMDEADTQPRTRATPQCLHGPPWPPSHLPTHKGTAHTLSQPHLSL